VKADEAADPEQIGLLGAQTVVLVADALAHLIEQPGGRARVPRQRIRNWWITIAVISVHGASAKA
jgi:hypothetical protein